jgi:hypothetical protein
MKTKLNVLIAAGLITTSLVALVPSQAQAFGKKQSSGVNAFEDAALTIAVVFAQTNPHYAPVLAALGIQTGADVKNLLSGDSSGANFKGVIAYMVLNYAQKNADAANWLNALGVKTFADVQKLLADPHSAIGQQTLFQMAFDFANQNSKYKGWLAALNLNSAADIATMFNGKFVKTNIQSQLISIGLAYIISKTKIGDTVLALLPLLHLGSFQGLDLGEIQQIVALIAKKA